MDIADYYLRSPNFTGDTTKYLRNDSEIRDDEDFVFVLSCLTYWKIKVLPNIVYDYLDKTTFKKDFDANFIGINNDIIEQIINYNNSKFIKIACGIYHSIGLKKDGTIVTWETMMIINVMIHLMVNSLL